MNQDSEKHSPYPFGMYTTDAKRWVKGLKEHARANRKNSTPAEKRLWQELRAQKMGAPFRRQHAIQQFIVDFVCLPAWLIIEVDGSIHDDLSQAEYDGGRTHDLQEAGFLVLRFTNEAVLHSTPQVLQAITEHLKLLLLAYQG
ncbi:endonuclease domain-containing protein [Hymenobacter cellulosivorans]|uniref:Endonuclease domain-containing protein n=1 Tax=Hymenobacter cellulosivorans TaxID=2932249 RepID=A0ABY4F5K2_9BACT|nr:endonuclease domain-containing protein [Hymenobacter cellulosivorans]UOQ51194.1 endonuclease domain-containing protein [Hymenobacter cellulosivorans]